MKHALSLALLASLLIALPSCSSLKEEAPEASAATLTSDGTFLVGPYSAFTGRADYPATYDTWKNDDLLKKAHGKNTKVRIQLGQQRAQLFVHNEVALDFPVSTGTKAFPTKTGNYKVLEKKTAHSSNLYGTMYNAEGKAVKYDADTTEDAMPEGGRFEGASMPYFMRLSGAGLGMHVGKVRRQPISHGCIRVMRHTCPIVFSKVSTGTPFEIKN